MADNLNNPQIYPQNTSGNGAANNSANNAANNADNNLSNNSNNYSQNNVQNFPNGMQQPVQENVYQNQYAQTAEQTPQEYIDLTPVQNTSNVQTYTQPQNQYFQVGQQQEAAPVPKSKFNFGSKIDFKKIQDWMLKKWWLILLVVIGFSLFGVGLFAIFARPPVPTGPFNNVIGEIQAPVTSPAGSPGTWRVKVTNNEKVNLENVEIKLKFDKSFRFTKAVNPEPSDTLGTTYSFARIAGNGLGTSEVLIQFEGVLTGQIDEETVMTGDITYTPSPLASQANNRRTIAVAAAKTKITAPEIKLQLVPLNQEVQNGSAAQLTATFENTSGRELKDLQIRFSYPDRNSFAYQSSELNLGAGSLPKTTPDNGNNLWNIPSLPSQQQASLIIRGTLSGADQSKQIFTMEIAIKSGTDYQVLANTARDITIVSQPLIISAVIEGRDSTKTFAQNENLVVTVNYENKSSKTLQNLEVLGFLDDPAGILDYSTISYVGGASGNLSNKVIQWRSSGNPSFLNVVPQQKGSVSFTIRTKSGGNFINSGLNQTAYTLRPRAQAKATNLEQIETSGDLYKAKGDLEFVQTITNKVVPTNPSNVRTYTVTWSLKTLQNKVNGVVVTTTTNLPPTSWQQASITPASLASQLVYNQDTGLITWNPGDLPAYTGGSNPIVSISFDINYTTGTNATNTLFEAARIVGLDDFTGERYTLQGQAGRAN
jgi:hypothetical protein